MHRRGAIRGIALQVRRIRLPIVAEPCVGAPDPVLDFPAGTDTEPRAAGASRRHPAPGVRTAIARRSGARVARCRRSASRRTARSSSGRMSRMPGEKAAQ